MKTKVCLLGVLAFVTLVVAAPRTWTLKTGEMVSGDYVSSGTATLVVKTGGANCFLNISDLSTNDLTYVAEIQMKQRRARLDAEVKQMRQAGMIEFTVNLIKNFPGKIRTKIPGDGTVIEQKGWMDATFEGFSDSDDKYLNFSVRDSNGDFFSYCRVVKLLKHHMEDEGTPNPFTDVVSKLKDGDRVRFFGNCDDALPFSLSRLDDKASHSWFYVDRIEMIESAAEKKAREDAAANEPDVTR